MGLRRDFILENLKHINAQQGSYYVFRAENDVIVDGRLLEEHSVSLDCPGCGNNINRSVSLSSLDGLKCSYCGASFQPEELMSIRRGIIEANRLSQPEKRGSDFSIVIFILLLFTIWPAAIMYVVIKRKAAVKKGLETVKEFSETRISDTAVSGSEFSF